MGDMPDLVSRAAVGLPPPRSTRRLNPSWGTSTHYNGPPMWRGQPVEDWSHRSCPTKVLAIHAFHTRTRGWQDIAYNHLICPHGLTFIGRGLRVRSAANGTAEGNDTAYAVMLLVGEAEPITPEMAAELARVIDWLQDEGGAGSGVGPHNAWKPTACPGPAASKLVDRIRGGWRPDALLEPPAPLVPDAEVAPWTAVASHPGGGYWMVNEIGWVFSFGGAPFHGSLGGVELEAPVVAMAARPQGDGYWLVTGEGGVFAFGAAPYLGNMVGTSLAAPVVDVTSTPSGAGYWLTAEDGGVFAFGDAVFAGSAVAIGGA